MSALQPCTKPCTRGAVFLRFLRSRSSQTQQLAEITEGFYLWFEAMPGSHAANLLIILRFRSHEHHRRQELACFQFLSIRIHVGRTADSS